MPHVPKTWQVINDMYESHYISLQSCFWYFFWSFTQFTLTHGDILWKIWSEKNTRLGGTKILRLNPPRRLLTTVLLSLTLLGGVLYFWWQSSLSTSEVSFPSGGSRTAVSDFSPALVLSCALPLPWRTSRPCTAGRVPAIAERYPDEKKRFEDFKEQQNNKQTKNVVNVGRLWCVW